MANANHNQSNFILGVRDAGPQPEGHFNSAKRITNYNVDLAGHLKKRKGFVKKQDLLNLGDKEVLQVLDFNGSYLFLLNDNIVYYLKEGQLYPLSCSPYTITRFNTNTLTSLSSNTITVDSDPLTTVLDSKDNNIFKLLQGAESVFAFSSTHFAFFSISVEDNIIEIKPSYLQDNDTASIYNLLRHIPLEVDEVQIKPFFDSDADLTKDLRIVIDRESNLDTNKAEAWLGLRSGETVAGSVDTNKIALEDFIGKPLFFNVFPDQSAIINKTLSYEQADNFTSGGTVLRNLNTIYDIGNFATTALRRRYLMAELLFGRKYCLIPIKRLEDSLAGAQDYNNVFFYNS